MKHLTMLDLSSNSIGGEIPNVFSNLQELVELFLSTNNFIGPFSSSILSLTHFEVLYLERNSLSGPPPSNTSMLQKLPELGLFSNILDGTIPSSVFSFPILELKLNHNRFRGLDDELKTNLTLDDLYLSHNQLNGPIPQSLANLINLVRIVLSSNNITDNVGIEFLKTMQILEHIDLSWRTGIKGSKITLSNLKVLFISSCEPKDFPHLLRNGKTLKGLLPSSICNMSGLTFFGLSHNYFSDFVPYHLGIMVELSVSDLRRNNFIGSLPPLCVRSTSLCTIVLNGNHFEGTVPMSLLNCDGLEVLDVGNNAINDTF
ncbi:hypothetical protein HAX54_047918 [Datura stramonium]|uniref:Uncharacterized protein n=1 Tax=Datura stramonium TaxID=4076 RepID=A0ABS8STI5_DATST|nr:hypothetical protein [Datura stramonium]